MVNDGVLVPNSELGHLEIDGHDAESRAANSAREREELSWEDWAERLTPYYRNLEMLFSPDLFVVGGGVSKDVRRVPARCSTSTPRSSPRRCATGPASSAPRSTPPQAGGG